MNKVTALPELDAPPKTLAKDSTNADQLAVAKEHPLFFKFSDKQQNFCLAFLQSKNPRKAAYAAYNCADDKNADYQARKLLKRWDVRKFLSDVGGFKFQGYPLSQQETDHLISERLRDEQLDTKTFASLVQLFARLQGWDTYGYIQSRNTKPASDERVKAVAEEPEPEQDVMTLVHQLEQRKKKKSHAEEESEEN